MKYLFLFIAIWLAVIVGAVGLYYTIRLVYWVTEEIDAKFEYYEEVRKMKRKGVKL